MLLKPRRGEVWVFNLNPTTGREQANVRPCLVLSTNSFNDGLAGVIIVVPFTSKNRNIRLHIPVLPPEGGLIIPSYLMAEQLRSLSTDRIASSCIGKVSEVTLQKLEYMIKILLNFR